MTERSASTAAVFTVTFTAVDRDGTVFLAGRPVTDTADGIMERFKMLCDLGFLGEVNVERLGRTVLSFKEGQVLTAWE